MFIKLNDIWLFLSCELITNLSYLRRLEML